MAKVIHTGDFSLDAALIHEAPEIRMFARLAASQASEELVAWVQAEVNRPGVQVADIFLVMARWSAQTHASVASQFFPPEAIPTLVKMFQRAIEDQYPEVYRKSREIHAGRRREAGHG